MDSNLIVQYSLVGLCLLGAIIWMIRKATKRNKNKSCCGCPKSDTCFSAIAGKGKGRKGNTCEADTETAKH